jgi:hypothetical protein
MLAERARRETGGLWLRDIPAEFVLRNQKVEERAL